MKSGLAPPEPDGRATHDHHLSNLQPETAARQLKNALAVHSGDTPLRDAPAPAEEAAVIQGVALTDRAATLAEFEDYLRTTNNRDGRPYEEGTINAYVNPGKNLDEWLTTKGIDGDFTNADTATLNKYFREYYLGTVKAERTLSSGTCSSCSTTWNASETTPAPASKASTATQRSKDAPRPCPPTLSTSWR